MIPPRAPASLSWARVCPVSKPGRFLFGPSADKRREPAHGCDRPCRGCRWIATHPPQSRMCAPPECVQSHGTGRDRQPGTRSGHPYSSTYARRHGVGGNKAQRKAELLEELKRLEAA